MRLGKLFSQASLVGVSLAVSVWSFHAKAAARRHHALLARLKCKENRRPPVGILAASSISRSQNQGFLPARFAKAEILRFLTAFV
jgi:hypothetical protein